MVGHLWSTWYTKTRRVSYECVREPVVNVYVVLTENDFMMATRWRWYRLIVSLFVCFFFSISVLFRCTNSKTDGTNEWRIYRGFGFIRPIDCAFSDFQSGKFCVHARASVRDVNRKWSSQEGYLVYQIGTETLVLHHEYGAVPWIDNTCSAGESDVR